MSQEESTVSNPSIRPRRDGDIPGAAKVLVKVHATDGYPVEGVSKPETWLTPPELMNAWVAELEERVVGHIGVCRPDGDEAASLWIRQTGEPPSQVAVAARLFVSPEVRGTGVGGKLLHAIVNFAERESIRLIFEVMVKDATAIRLYEKLGCREFARTVHHYGHGQQTDAICYVWPSTASV